MKNMFYPAYFHREDNAYWVDFPDLPGCFTQGDNIDDAYNMALDALGVYLNVLEDKGISIPEASDASTLNVPKDAFLVIVRFDMAAYLKSQNKKAVKKTLSIPSWLNDKATAAGVNFSQVLQDALMQKLNLI